MTQHLLKYDSPIYNLQVFLRTISQKYPLIPNVLPDGYYGDATVKAVIAFQNMHGHVCHAHYEAVYKNTSLPLY